MRQRCEGCPFKQSPVVHGRGRPGGVMIIGQAPGPTEARRGRIFTGLSGQILESCVSQMGFEDVYYSNAISCANHDDPTTEQIEACRPEMWKEIETVKPKKILLMGNSSVQSLFPGAKNITSLRPNRLFHKELGVWCVPTLNAAAALHDPNVFTDISNDFEILSTVDSWKPKWTTNRPPPYKLVLTPAAFFKMLDELDRSTHLSLDIETTGLNCMEDEMLSIGIGDQNSTWIMPVEGPNNLMESMRVRRAMQKLLEDPNLRWVAQNGYQFDWKWFWTKWRIDWRISFDPMLAHYTLDERQLGHNLKSLCRQYLGYPDYAVDIKGRFENYGDIPRLELWQYQAWDVRGAWELHDPLANEMAADTDTDLRRLHDEILLPGTKALAIIELNGIAVDESYLTKVGKQLDDELSEVKQKLQWISDEEGTTDLDKAINDEIVARENLAFARTQYDSKQITWKEFVKVRSTWIQARDAIPANTFNPNSPLQVKKLISQKLRLTFDTTKEGLEAVEHRHPAPKLINEFRGKSKLKGTYVDGLLERRYRSTNRVHGNFLAIGTRTGRLSGQDPNWQNVPVLVGPIIRDGVVPTAGWALGEVDNSQVELRTAGVFSRDERLIQVYKDGRDIHREVAVTMYNKSAEEITDRERYEAKYVDFPILFGATPESLVGSGDPPWDLPTARKFHSGFLGGFPQLSDWLDHQRRSVKTQGFVLTLFGRKRRYPMILDANVGDIERQSINSPIQGSASDLCFTALTRITLELFERLKRGEPVECRTLWTVHDSIGFEAIEGKEEFYATWIKTEMERYPDMWPDVGMPLKAEIKLGSRWGSMHEIKPDPELVEIVKQPWYPGMSDAWVRANTVEAIA